MTNLENSASITASDLVVLRLHQHGINQAFGVVGGAIMFITDALRRCKGFRSIFTHHEQGAAIAAEAYSKLTHKPALVFATAGPGTTNTITGVADAYMDSIPMVVLIGDVRSTIAADFNKQRSNAPQEVNQAALMRPIVKGYSQLKPDMDESAIIAIVDQAVQDCCQGRPGPVCISMPLDVQGVECNPKYLEAPIPRIASNPTSNHQDLVGAMQALLSAKRPLVLLGAGVRISGMVASVEKLIAQYDLPWCVTIGAVDLQDYANPLSVGCVGPTSQRAANFLLHASDCVLALGTSFDQSVTGFNITELLRNKKVYLVNVDSGENLRFDNPAIKTIEASITEYCDAVCSKKFSVGNHGTWRGEVQNIKERITQRLEVEIRTSVSSDFPSAYDVTNHLSQSLPNDACVVLGISIDAISTFNAFEVKHGQRIIVSRNLGPMGWDIPALLGAAIATDKARTLVLITGDGSLMVNVQELSVISGMQIPAFILVFNNDGYVSIRTTQANFFGTSFFGCDAASGLHLPALEPLARGFGFEYDCLNVVTDISLLLDKHNRVGLPRIIECRISPSQLREPRLVSQLVDGRFKSPALHDMTPPLPEHLAGLVNRLLHYG